MMGVHAAYCAAAKRHGGHRGFRTSGAVQVGGHSDLVDPGPVQQRLKEGVGVAQLVRLDQVDVCGKAGSPAQSDDAERCGMTTGMLHDMQADMAVRLHRHVSATLIYQQDIVIDCSTKHSARIVNAAWHLSANA